MTHQAMCKIGADHPCLAGHFPDNPVVPGVVILDEIFYALRAWNNVCEIATISTVKFLAPIKPDQEFMIILSEIDPKRIEFKCSSADTVFVTGKISLK